MLLYMAHTHYLLRSFLKQNYMYHWILQLVWLIILLINFIFWFYLDQKEFHLCFLASLNMKGLVKSSFLANGEIDYFLPLIKSLVYGDTIYMAAWLLVVPLTSVKLISLQQRHRSFATALVKLYLILLLLQWIYDLCIGSPWIGRYNKKLWTPRLNWMVYFYFCSLLLVCPASISFSNILQFHLTLPIFML